jgi:Zn-dependent peptidase ImmA (M78 family)/transcriptional regulator with XRE-family HTH domain
MEDRQRIASRLRQAREGAGLTQAEVATVLGLPRPSISQIEAGDRAVRSEELMKLAQLFGKPVAFFLDEEEAEEALTWLFRGPNVVAEDRAPLQKGLALCAMYQELEKVLGLQPGDPLQFAAVPRPRTKGDAIRQGELAARHARDLLRLGTAPIGDLVGLLEVHGVKVVPCALRHEVSGAFVYSDTLGPCIFVNARHRSARQNFTLAHEYCHTLLDWERRAHLDLADFDKDPVETRADVFAAAFLMPEDALTGFLGRMGITAPRKHAFGPYDVARIAAHFSTSHLAVLWRLFNLGYIDGETRDALKEGTRWTEVAATLGIPEIVDALAEKVRRVSPERLRDMAVEAYRRGRISLGKLAEYLGMTLAQAKAFVHKAEIEPEDAEDEG